MPAASPAGALAEASCRVEAFSDYETRPMTYDIHRKAIGDFNPVIARVKDALTAVGFGV